METNEKAVGARRIRRRIAELPVVKDSKQSCDFNGYDADMLMNVYAALLIL